MQGPTGAGQCPIIRKSRGDERTNILVLSREELYTSVAILSRALISPPFCAMRRNWQAKSF